METTGAFEYGCQRKERQEQDNDQDQVECDPGNLPAPQPVFSLDHTATPDEAKTALCR
jgi:hypothetical protein